MRPERSGDFNGTVVVNWQNVSAGYETSAPSDGEVYDGYAWVGVSAQEIGLYGSPLGTERFRSRRSLPLLEHDPDRYESLHHPGDQGSFDIFRHAGLVVGQSRPTDVDPLGGLDVRRLVATGGSQSAMRLVTYVNAFHRDAPVFDAFLLSVWEGRAPRPEEGAVAMGVRTAIRTDLTAPIVVVNSEFETSHLIGLDVEDAEHLRIWEVAGAPHGVARTRDDRPDARGRVVNRLSIAPIQDAALRGVHQWITAGIPVPSQPRIVIDDGRPSSIRRDEEGNAVGGIRLPELDAPTAAYRGAAFGTGRAPLFGAARPFSDDELRARYPSRSVYRERWCATVDALVASWRAPPRGRRGDAGTGRRRRPPRGLSPAAPGMLPARSGYPITMPSEQSPDLLDSLKVAAAALRDAEIPFALAGGLAVWAHGGPPTEHDIDLMIRPEDASRALTTLGDAGLEVESPPEGWLVKAWHGDVLLDLIFDPKGIDVDDRFLGHCQNVNVAAVDMLVIPLDDLLVSKLLALTEHNLDFAPPLEWARAIREQVDWPAVAARTAASPFARTFLTMLAELGVIDHAVDGGATVWQRRTDSLRRCPRA